MELGGEDEALGVIVSGFTARPVSAGEQTSGAGSLGQRVAGRTGSRAKVC
jgi:hypothetical protein